MYAITEASYRVIASESDARPGETVVQSIPESVIAAIKVEEGRGRRNLRLRGSDWTQLADNTLTTVERTAWATYRQALRDLTDVPGFPDCEWPAAPSLDASASDGLPAVE